MTPTIYGMHDEGSMEVLPYGSWILITELVNDGMGKDYSAYTKRGLVVIVRLNNGYGSDGTIPLPDQYDYFAQKCAMFAETSTGCVNWIIGNEPNHAQEWPNGQKINPISYAECYRKCLAHITRRRPTHRVITAAVAPWNVQSGDWLQYFRVMLEACNDAKMGGVSLHTYTHGSDPSLVYSKDTMNPPYQDRFFHFLAYRDFMNAIPEYMRDKNVYITETNQDNEWNDANTGWVKNAYEEINRWNTHNRQKIHCLILYRWENFDKWHIRGKNGVIRDFIEAAKKGYYPIADEVSDEEYRMYLPSVVSEKTENDEIEWDWRLPKRGASVKKYEGNKNSYWKLVRGRWLDREQSQGKHHVFIEALGKNGKRLPGVPFEFGWSTGKEVKNSELKPGESYALDFPMYSVAPSYYVKALQDSDTVDGLGMGSIEEPHLGIHTSYEFTFQLVDLLQVPDNDIVKPKPQPTPPKPHAPLGDITVNDLVEAMSRVLNIDKCTAFAIMQVEAGDRFFDSTGNLLIRFENHVFCGLSSGHCPNIFVYDKKEVWKGHKFREGEGFAWVSTHENEKTESLAFEIAKFLDEDAAFRSISMGVAQIMGFNHHRIGYDTPQEMYHAFNDRVTGKFNQIVGLFSFINTSATLLESARKKDFYTFASLYNGPGNADTYSKLLEKAFVDCKVKDEQ